MRRRISPWQAELAQLTEGKCATWLDLAAPPGMSSDEAASLLLRAFLAAPPGVVCFWHPAVAKAGGLLDEHYDPTACYFALQSLATVRAARPAVEADGSVRVTAARAGVTGEGLFRDAKGRHWAYLRCAKPGRRGKRPPCGYCGEPGHVCACWTH